MGLANLAIDLNATPQFPIAEDRHPYRNNTTLNATPQFPIAEDRHPYRNNTLTPVRTHQPPAILQANVGQLYHFPATPPIPYAVGPPPTPVGAVAGNYGLGNLNSNQWSPNLNHDAAFFHEVQHTPSRTVTPPPSQPNISKHDLSLSPQKPKKRVRGGGPRGRGRGSRGGQGAGRGSSSTKGKNPAKDIEDPSAKREKKMADEIEIIEDDEVFVNAKWTDDDRTILFEYYLGPESEVFEKLKINAMYAHKKVRVSIDSYDISLALF